MRAIKAQPILQAFVSHERIQEAIRSNDGHCLIAEAIKRAYPRYTYVSVDLQTIRMTNKAERLRYIYLTPRIVQAALVAFDQGKSVRPFKFKLRGAHTVAANMANRQLGKSVGQRLKLGRRRVVPNGSKHPETVGGRALPKHPSANRDRKFGIRAFTDEDVRWATSLCGMLPSGT